MKLKTRNKSKISQQTKSSKQIKLGNQQQQIKLRQHKEPATKQNLKLTIKQKTHSKSKNSQQNEKLTTK